MNEYLSEHKLKLFEWTESEEERVRWILTGTDKIDKRNIKSI